MAEESITDIIRSGHNDLLRQRLLEEPSVADMKTAEGSSLLQYAAYCRNNEAVELLKPHRPDLNIFEAACLGETQVVKDLLGKEHDLINSFSADGFTILGLASFFGHAELVRYLLVSGADPDMASDNAQKVTPLHSACAISDFTIADMLIRRGADVNVKQAGGYTPLHSAAHNGKSDLVLLLISNGADPDARSDKGETPATLALEKGFAEIADLIRKQEA